MTIVSWLSQQLLKGENLVVEQTGVANIILQAASASVFAKILVDAAKKVPTPLPGWAVLGLNFLLSQMCAFLLAFTMNMVMDKAGVSSTVLVGIAAFGGAIGVAT